MGSLVFVFIAYFITAKLFLPHHYGWGTLPATIWPPVGIALVAVIFGGYRMWIPIFLAQFFSVYTQPEATYPAALLSAGAHAVEAVVALYFLRLLKFNSALRDSRSMFILLGITFIVTLIAPLISTTAQVLLTTPIVSPVIHFGNGWGAGIFSALVITPFVLT
jgi:hypothetical protein